MRPVIRFPRSYIQTGSIREMSLSPDNTPEGYFPPFEVAKAYLGHGSGREGVGQAARLAIPLGSAVLSLWFQLGSKGFSAM